MELPNFDRLWPKQLQTIALRSERTIEGEEALICIRREGGNDRHTYARVSERVRRLPGSSGNGSLIFGTVSNLQISRVLQKWKRSGDDELVFVDSMVHIRSAFFPLATMQKVERAMLYEDCTRSSPAPRAFFAYIRAAETSSTSFPPLGFPTKHCIRESSAISPG
jgi:hypothetical protein